MSDKSHSFADKIVYVVISLMLLFLFVFFTPIFFDPAQDKTADYELDENNTQDDVWQIEDIFDDIVTISVNGKVVHGDKYRVFFTPVDQEWCHNPQSSITLLSVVENAEEKFNNLPSNALLASINNERVLFEISDINDFIGVVKNALINIGVMQIDDLIDYYQDYDEIEIEILAFYDRDEDKVLQDDINDYFAFPKNIYSLTGFEETIQAGKEMCLANISKETKL